MPLAYFNLTRIQNFVTSRFPSLSSNISMPPASQNSIALFARDIVHVSKGSNYHQNPPTRQVHNARFTRSIRYPRLRSHYNQHRKCTRSQSILAGPRIVPREDSMAPSAVAHLVRRPCVPRHFLGSTSVSLPSTRRRDVWDRSVWLPLLSAPG